MKETMADRERNYEKEIMKERRREKQLKIFISSNLLRTEAKGNDHDKEEEDRSEETDWMVMIDDDLFGKF